MLENLKIENPEKKMTIEKRIINKLSFDILRRSICCGMLGNKNSLEIAVKNSVGIIKKTTRLICKLFFLICLIVPKIEIKQTNNKE